MRIIAKKTLKDFWKVHSDSEQPLKCWYNEVRKSGWRNPNEIKVVYPSASILPANRIVFNIKGNKYRLIVKINYNYQIAWIRFIGTHKEYDKINSEKI